MERGALDDVAVLATQIDVVQHADQGAEDAGDRGLLAHLGSGLDPAARVDVLGLIALELLGELGDLALELGDASGIGRGAVVAALGGLLEELRRLGIDRIDGLGGALALGRGGGPGGTERGVLRVHVALVGEGERRLTLWALSVVGSAPVLGHHFFSSSSSTISASTTSSS